MVGGRDWRRGTMGAGRGPCKLIAKVVMAVADGRMVMLVLPGHHPVDLDRAAAGVASRAQEHGYTIIDSRRIPF